VPPSNTANWSATARFAVGIFFPQRLVLRLDSHGYRPALLDKIVTAGAEVKSFAPAERLLTRRHFVDFEPIAEFVHVLSYVHVAAHAVSGAGGWGTFERCLRACWQGDVAVVIEELAGWLQQEEPPAAGAPPRVPDPREVARRSLGYLRNNANRMNYPRYRCQGSPCESAWMELPVKEFDYRVKWSEKFWNEAGNAEAILQARAAVLSEDDRLSRQNAERAGSAFRRTGREWPPRLLDHVVPCPVRSTG
jgi:hypothetical protein